MKLENPKHSQNLKHAKKPSPASTTKKYTGKYPRKNEIYQNN